MTAINRQPTGWLGFLGIKNFGRNPSAAAEILAPTWDLSDLYLNTNRLWITTTATISSLGTNITGAVPAGQVWVVNAYSYRSVILAAGNTLEIQPVIYNIPLAATAIIGASSGVKTTGQYATAFIPRPVILNPGESLGMFVSQFAGAAIGCEVSFAYTRLDA